MVPLFETELMEHCSINTDDLSLDAPFPDFGRYFIPSLGAYLSDNLSGEGDASAFAGDQSEFSVCCGEDAVSAVLSIIDDLDIFMLS
jgi:hypothetical protein